MLHFGKHEYDLGNKCGAAKAEESLVLYCVLFFQEEGRVRFRDQKIGAEERGPASGREQP